MQISEPTEILTNNISKTFLMFLSFYRRNYICNNISFKRLFLLRTILFITACRVLYRLRKINTSFF